MHTALGDFLNAALPWIVGVGIPAIAAVIAMVRSTNSRVSSLELQMRDRVTRQEASKLIETAMHGVESKVDLILRTMLDRNHHDRD